MNILVITSWSFSDPLVQGTTLSYVKIIKRYNNGEIWFVTYESYHKTRERKQFNKAVEELNNQGIHPVFLVTHKNILLAIFFSIYNIFKLLLLIKKNKIEALHPWCTPAGIIAVVLKMFQPNLILNHDGFEPHAEAMVQGGVWQKSSMKNKILFYFEKIEARKSNNLIFVADGMGEYVKAKYGVEVSKYYVKPCCVDLNFFSEKDLKDSELMMRYMLNDKVVGLYAGKFGGIYLEDETFQFIKQCEEYWGRPRFRLILLSSASGEYVNTMIAKYKIGQEVIVKLFLPHNQMPKYMGLADFAICPVKPVPAKRYCSPIKDGEYWAMGLPVVITPGISNDSDIVARNNAGAVIETFDEAGYLKAIKRIDSIISTQSRAEVYAKIRPLAEKYRNFSIAESVYKELYSE